MNTQFNISTRTQLPFAALNFPPYHCPSKGRKEGRMEHVGGTSSRLAVEVVRHDAASSDMHRLGRRLCLGAFS
jgi:hypothetical protein